MIFQWYVQKTLGTPTCLQNNPVQIAPIGYAREVLRDLSIPLNEQFVVVGRPGPIFSYIFTILSCFTMDLYYTLDKDFAWNSILTSHVM